jgi:hypothetical protein
MNSVTWEMCFSNFATFTSQQTFPRQHLIIEDGASFTGNLCIIKGPFAIEYRGTSIPAFSYDFDQAQPMPTGLMLQNAASIWCSGGQPFFYAKGFLRPPNDPYFTIVYMESGTGLGVNSQPTSPVVVIDGSVLCPVNITGGTNIIKDNTLGGSGQFLIVVTTTVIFTDGSGAGFVYDPATQPSVTGNINYVRFVTQTFTKSGVPTVNDDGTIGQYINGDVWIDQNTNDIYMLANNASGAAVWKLL